MNIIQELNEHYPRITEVVQRMGDISDKVILSHFTCSRHHAVLENEKCEDMRMFLSMC